LPLALIHIALSGTAKLANPREDARRLFMADELMKEGVDPSVIVRGLGFALSSIDEAFDKYSPGQPRVPAGNPDGGQWTRADGRPKWRRQAQASGRQVVNSDPKDDPHPASEMSFADIGTLVAQQNLGGVTICIYRSNVFGDYFQITYSGVCPQTMPRPQ
jgi:hypothetical protein